MTKMTNAEAIDILDGLKTNWMDGGKRTIAIDMAIAALQADDTRPAIDVIAAVSKDMLVVDTFLGLKGRFVGNMVHIGISDLAERINALKPEPIEGLMEAIEAADSMTASNSQLP